MLHRTRPPEALSETEGAPAHALAASPSHPPPPPPPGDRSQLHSYCHRRTIGNDRRCWFCRYWHCHFHSQPASRSRGTHPPCLCRLCRAGVRRHPQPFPPRPTAPSPAPFAEMIRRMVQTRRYPSHLDVALMMGVHSHRRLGVVDGSTCRYPSAEGQQRKRGLLHPVPIRSTEPPDHPAGHHWRGNLLGVRQGPRSS